MSILAGEAKQLVQEGKYSECVDLMAGSEGRTGAMRFCSYWDTYYRTLSEEEAAKAAILIGEKDKAERAIREKESMEREMLRRKLAEERRKSGFWEEYEAAYAEKDIPSVANVIKTPGAKVAGIGMLGLVVIAVAVFVVYKIIKRGKK